MPSAQANPVTRTRTRVTEPPRFRVIYVNDDKTTMEFVIESLTVFFDYSPEGAADLAQEIHHAGSATVAVLPYEIAEQKGVEITLLARQQGFPLQIKLEPEDTAK